jgi:hypothetical protein
VSIQPISKPTPRPKRRGHADPVTPELHDYIIARDHGCIGARLDMEGPCDGPLQIDHILNGGIGKRGPSIPLNLVALCQKHHMAKTDHARAWRPLLVEYVCSVEPPT